MRVLHLSDVHCKLVNLRRLFKETGDEYDVVAVTGDLECDDEAVDILVNQPKPVLYVPGNMDDVGLAKVLEEAGLNIDAKIMSLHGFYFAGIGGLSTLSSLNAVRKKIEETGIDTHKLIVLAHHPPKASRVDRVREGLNAGLRELREFITAKKPRIFLHGHIHESPGSELIGDTLVVNAGPLMEGCYAIVDVEQMIAHHKRLR